MSRALIEEAVALLEEKKRRQSQRKLLTYFPDKGPLRRELYPKHQEFFAAGRQYRERLMMAANRVGKTEGVGGYETALHLTGWYPDWWTEERGFRRYDRPIKGWAAGDTSKTVRDIIQAKLLGPPGERGTGLIPGEMIERVTAGRGVTDSVDTIYVKHKSGGTSRLVLKSYDQRRESFQGTEQDLIWLDEEPPMDIYIECLLRTMTCDGMVMLTFTPLQGLSEVVLTFLPGGELKEQANGSKFVVMATWDDAPHLGDAVKKELWNSIPPYQRDARSKGVPQLGSGAIYPVPESEIIVDPFAIPEHWPRGYGMDVGWNWTAAMWAALDRETDTTYLFHEYKRGQAEPSVHAHGVKAPGDWMHGEMDPAANGRAQDDGEALMQKYRALGLHLSNANNAVEAGLYEVWLRLSTGRLKVFSTLSKWREEYRLYRRNEKGRIVKENDHLMDATRYRVMDLNSLKVKPAAKKAATPASYNRNMGQGWMS